MDGIQFSSATNVEPRRTSRDDIRISVQILFYHTAHGQIYNTRI